MRSMPLASTLIAGLALLPAGSARAQAVVNPNQVVGTVSFTNTNPEILAVLAETRPYWFWWQFRATSLDAAAPLYTTSSESSPTREGVPYEMTVESSDAGIRYAVHAVIHGQAGKDEYTTATCESPPVQREPSPDARLDMAECAALLRVTFTDPSGAPSAITGGRMWTYRSGESNNRARTYFDAGATEGSLLVRADGLPTMVFVRWTVGSDPYSDQVTYEKRYDLAPACDDVLRLECRGDADAATCGRGRIVGRFDLLGEEEIARAPWTRVAAEDGPWANSRYDRIGSTPASGAFELENLVSSSVVDPPVPYWVKIEYEHGRGTRFHRGRSAYRSVQVGCGEDVDLGDWFVMDPAHVTGPLVLAGPPDTPPLGSLFESLCRPTDPDCDPDGDGLPDCVLAANGASHVYATWASGGSDGLVFGADVSAAFAGDPEPGTGAFIGTHELVLPAPGGRAGRWNASELRLSFAHEMASGDPLSHVASWAQVRDVALERVTLLPAELVEAKRAACFGLVRLGFVATSGTFCLPAATVDSYAPPPLDFLGRAEPLDVEGRASGTPLDAAGASSVGLVQFPLPEGRYVLQPSVWALDPSGGSSNVEVLPVAVTVGCRQVLEVLPELVVAIRDVAPCAEKGLVPLHVRVQSTDVVERTWVSVAGVGETVLCEPCGLSPELDVVVALGAGDHEIVAQARDVRGRVSSATAHALGAREPSAMDRRPASPPLRVARRGSDELALAWEDTGAPADVYRGTLRALRVDARYDHAGFGACGLVGGGASVSMPAEDSYFLVTGTCSWGNAAPGRDSFGRPRPLARERCP